MSECCVVISSTKFILQIFENFNPTSAGSDEMDGTCLPRGWRVRSRLFDLPRAAVLAINLD